MPRQFPKVRGVPVQHGIFPAVRPADLRQWQTLPASQNYLFCEVAKVRKTSVAFIGNFATKENHDMESIIEIATIKDVEAWAELRVALWPHHSLEDHRAELGRAFLSESGEAVAFIARNAANEAVGFAEATLRHDYVNGCSSSPVLFLEGIFVRPVDRRKGIARSLCNAVADWGKSLGCVEFGSDARLENSASHALHTALGFEETQRVVFFRKPL
ncbi:aminoglycoside 6'-N-acetyltransferase I [Rhizobium leguminosarum]